MANKKKIKELNGDAFFEDLKLCSEINAFCKLTGCFMKARKIDLMELAERKKVHYYLTNEIYVVKRMVMVIL